VLESCHSRKLASRIPENEATVLQIKHYQAIMKYKLNLKIIFVIKLNQKAGL